MTTLLVPWLLFPVVLGLVSLGCGLLLDRVAVVRLPGALLLPAGLAVVMVVLRLFTTTLSATASLTPRLQRRVDRRGSGPRRRVAARDGVLSLLGRGLKRFSPACRGPVRLA